MNWATRLEARPSIYKMQGISLVELLVALALGAFLMLGLTQVFLANLQTSRLQDDFSRVQENGRIGVEMLVKEIRMADFNGCMPSTANITNLLDTTDTDYDAANMDFLAGGVGGANNVSATVIGGKTLVNGTDTLILRGMVDACGGLGRMTGTNPAASFSISNVDCPITQGDILVLASCSGGDMFSVSNRNMSNVTVVHNTGTNTLPGSVENASSILSRTYRSGSNILKPYNKTFFVSDGVDGNSLFLNDTGTVIELVTNITDFQIQYGEDTDGDGAINIYRTANNVADFAEVKSVEITLTVASGDVDKTYKAIGNIRNRTNI
jgi:type IV pilus assembly protein PilW